MAASGCDCTHDSDAVRWSWKEGRQGIETRQKKGKKVEAQDMKKQTLSMAAMELPFRRKRNKACSSSSLLILHIYSVPTAMLQVDEDDDDNSEAEEELELLGGGDGAGEETADASAAASTKAKSVRMAVDSTTGGAHAACLSQV